MFIKDFNAYYSGVEIKYDTGYPGENGECICGDDYCRCSTINDAHAISVDIVQLVQGFTQPHWVALDKYAVDRILRINKVYDLDKWEVRVSGGYYGEEVDGVYLEESTASTVDSQIAVVISLKDNNLKVEEILRLEYGHLLPILEGRTWAVEKIDAEEIKNVNEEYQRKIDTKSDKIYKSYKGIRGVVIPKDDSYRLIDGYHRCSEANGKISVIVGRLLCEKKRKK